MTRISFGRKAFFMLKLRRSTRVAFSRPIPTMYCLHAGPVYMAFWKQGVRP